jgi:predicted nucleic acid-binding protein
VAAAYSGGVGSPDVKWLIDTNVLLYAAAKEKECVAFLDAVADSEWIGYSAITRLELFGYPDLKPEDEKKLKEMLEGFSEVDVSSLVIDRAIEVRRVRRVRTPDAILAATALVLGATLVTRNTDDFKAIKGLRLLNPYEPTVGK